MCKEHANVLGIAGSSAVVRSIALSATFQVYLKVSARRKIARNFPDFHLNIIKVKYNFTVLYS